MAVSTIEWVDGRIRMIDQTLLPNEFKQIYCDDLPSVREAIKSLRVRGAPADRYCGCVGCSNWHMGFHCKHIRCFYRPNLNPRPIIWRPHDRQPLISFGHWTELPRQHKRTVHLQIPELKEVLLAEALKIIDEDKAMCRAIGQHGYGVAERKRYDSDALQRRWVSDIRLRHSVSGYVQCARGG